MLSRGGTLATRWFHETHTIYNQQSDDRGGVSIPCGVVPTRGIAIFVLVLLKLCMNGIFSFGDDNLLSPGATELRRCPEGQISPREAP